MNVVLLYASYVFANKGHLPPPPPPPPPLLLHYFFKGSMITYTMLHAFCNHDINHHMRAFNIYVSQLIEFYCYVWLPSLYYNTELIENIQHAFTRRTFKKCHLMRIEYYNRLEFVKKNMLLNSVCCIIYLHIL